MYHIKKLAVCEVTPRFVAGYNLDYVTRIHRVNDRVISIRWLPDHYYHDEVVYSTKDAEYNELDRYLQSQEKKNQQLE